MKIKWMLVVWLLAVAARAQEVEWPTTQVVGLVGASFGSCQAPVDSPLLGVGLAGCSFEGLDIALARNRFLEAHNFTVQSAAAGGAYSYDVPGTGWQGYASQYASIYTRSAWPFDGENRLRYVVVSIANDCLHSVPCSLSDIDNTLIQNVIALADLADSQGVSVIVNGYPSWSDLDLLRAAQIYGLTWTIAEADYELLSTRHRQVLSAHPNVLYLSVWNDNFVSIDGLHPNKDSVTNAARRIARTVINNSP